MSATTRLEQRLLRHVTHASMDFQMLEAHDRVMVAVSGGKDSYCMLHLLERLRRKAPFPFELVAVNLDQGHPGYPGHLLEGWLQAQGYAYRMLARDTYKVVQEKIQPGATYCSLCSRLRRGILYTAAVELGCTKIALGHHRDDMIETLMLNLLYSGQLKSMPPRLRSDDGRNVVIRPLAYCPEVELAALAEEQAFPIIPCDLCGSQDNLKRQEVKRLIASLEATNDKIRGNMFAAMGNVRPSHLMDARLRELAGLDAVTGEDAELLALG